MTSALAMASSEPTYTYAVSKYVKPPSRKASTICDTCLMSMCPSLRGSRMSPNPSFGVAQATSLSITPPSLSMG